MSAGLTTVTGVEPSAQADPDRHITARVAAARRVEVLNMCYPPEVELDLSRRSII